MLGSLHGCTATRSVHASARYHLGFEPHEDHLITLVINVRLHLGYENYGLDGWVGALMGRSVDGRAQWCLGVRVQVAAWVVGVVGSENTPLEF